MHRLDPVAGAAEEPEDLARVEDRRWAGASRRIVRLHEVVETTAGVQGEEKESFRHHVVPPRASPHPSPQPPPSKGRRDRASPPALPTLPAAPAVPAPAAAAEGLGRADLDVDEGHDVGVANLARDLGLELGRRIG